MLLPRQDTIKKGQIDKNNVAKLKINNNKGEKYKVKAI